MAFPTNTTPPWKSYMATGNAADIVASTTVATAIGAKVDASGGQASDLEIIGGSLSSVSLDTSTATATGGTSSRSLASRFADFLSVKDFGAKGDGTTDDTSAINAALSSGANYIFVPAGTYYLTATISIPAHVSLYGLGGPLVDNPPSYGTVFLFENTVSTCVEIGVINGPVHLTSRFERIAVVRDGGASSTIPSGSIGVSINNSQAVVLDNVTSYGHDIAYSITGANPDGITAWMNFCNSGRVQTSHLVVDSMPEVRVSNSRFGMNGTGDIDCVNFISITGGNTTNTAGGPNTIIFNNTQFNQGENTVTNWLNFNNQLSGSVSDTGLIVVSDCYIETIDNGIVSDASWPIIRRLIFSNNEFNKDGAEWFALNSATTLQDCTFSNNIFYGNISIDCTLDHVLFSNIYCDQTVSFKSESSSSTLSISGLACVGELTFSGAWSNLIASNLIHGTLVNTATGNVAIQDVAGASYAGDFTVSSSGGTFAVTYGSTGKASFQNDGNFVIYSTSSDEAILAVGSSTPSITANVPVQYKTYAVADLPTTSVSAGCTAYATNGRKPSEAAGSGTGVPVFYSGTEWFSYCSGEAVSA